MSEIGKMETQLCGSCKWMNQGESSCHCFNPNQTNQDLIGYVYWNFDCPLHEKGERPTKKQMRELGYGYFKGEHGFMYYAKFDETKVVK